MDDRSFEKNRRPMVAYSYLKDVLQNVLFVKEAQRATQHTT